MKTTRKKYNLQNAPLDHVPDNEQETIFLFSQMYRQLGFTKVLKFQPHGFPDCMAYRGKKQIGIEFELKSSSFLAHGHNPKECDYLVCWEDNWQNVPKNLKVIELRNYFMLNPNVWMISVGKESKNDLDNEDYHEKWSVPAKVYVGDIILFYYNAPDSAIKNIFVAEGKKVREQAGDWNNRETDIYAPVRMICRLDNPLSLKEMQNDDILKESGFVKRDMNGKCEVTEYAPKLRELILAKNPEIEGKLRTAHWE